LREIQNKNFNFMQMIEVGLRHHQAGQLNAAGYIYRQIIVFDPSHSDALHLLGVVAYQEGRDRVAVDLIGKAIYINGAAPFYYSNLGNALKNLCCFKDALAAYDNALMLQNDYAECYYNKAAILWQINQIKNAIINYKMALIQKPDYAKAYCNNGNILKYIGEPDAAITAYNAAIAIHPDFFEALTNCSNALNDLGFLDRALSVSKTAIVFGPDFAEAYLNHGNVLKNLGCLEDAIAAYGAAICLRPNLFEAHSNRLLALQYVEQSVEEAILPAMQSFSLNFGQKIASFPSNSEISPQRKLRIGYVSGDFGRHPIGYYILPVLENHLRNDFIIYCYSTSLRNDDLTERLMSCADYWRNLEKISDIAAAEMVRGDGIDILVDLSGHTANNRLSMFSLCVAPVQASWMATFGSIGLPAIDYIIADEFVAPVEEDGFFSERVWRLPGSYLCFPPPDTEILIEPNVGRNNGAITFGSFNNNVKISPLTIDLWSRVLKQVPNSNLLLKTKALADETARSLLRERFASCGISSERLHLEGGGTRADMLSAYNRVDIALDTMPFGGGITTAEALWMGVPVVTLRGRTWAGRVSQSILVAVGLSELVAGNADDYVSTAVRTSAGWVPSAESRKVLRAAVEASPLCDGRGFTRNLERAYRSMWEAWCNSRARSS